MRELEHSGQAYEIQRSGEYNPDLLHGVDGVGILSSALVCQVDPINQSNGEHFNAVRALNKHMTKELSNPRKRRVSLVDENTESGKDRGDDSDNDSVGPQIEESFNDSTSHSYIRYAVLECKFNQ